MAVIDVDPDSRAWQQGLRGGMFISHARERRVGTPAEFHAAVGDVTGPVELRLATYRAGQRETFIVDDGSRP